MSDKFNDKYRIKSARLEGYDYRNEGLYYVTICTKNRVHFFGECENVIMLLNDLGKMAEDCWLAIPIHFPNVSLDEFIIMPNYIHGIVCINEKIEIERTSLETYNYTSLQMPKNPHFQKLSAPAKSLSTIIRAFKTVVTTESRKINPNFAWQPRFHDHIIRDAQSFNNIQNYIINNPTNLKNDEFYS